MSDRHVGIRRESRPSGNYIPVGRQLPRTPPLDDVKACLVFCDDEPGEGCGSLETGDRDQDDSHPDEMFDYVTAETKPEPNDHSMLKGMKGYQLTEGDLEFIRKMKEEKLLKKLEGDLEELRRALKKGMMTAELVYASRENAQIELKKFPSCEELTECAKLVLGTKMPSDNFADLDVKSLLAMVTADDVQKVIDRKRIELAQRWRTAENKRKKEAKARECLEKQTAKEQMKIRGLMSRLSELKSQLAQEEEVSEALELRLKLADDRSAARDGAGTRTKPKRGAVAGRPAVTGRAAGGSQRQAEERESNPESERAATGQRKPPAAAQAKSRGRGRAGAGRPAVTGRAAGGSQRQAEERESNPESERPATGQRKPPAAAQAKSRGRGRAGAAPASSRREAAVAAEVAGPRRSKRIAGRS